MGSPYNYSRFAFPNAPHPTPASTTYTLRPPKPPIHNPYDKFPQSEFDAWIGGITGALRKALGQEPERAETPNREVTRDNSIDQDESFVDDSFAEIKARRQDKGKEKESEPGGDARFGAGVGNRDQPIHIDWDAEEVESGSPVAAPWTVEEEMEAEEVDVIAQGPASPSEAFLVTEGEDSEEEELGDDDDDDGDDEGQAGPSIVTDIGGDEGVESGSGSSSEGDSVFEVENTVQQPARSSGQVGPPQKYIDVERESSDDDSEMEDDQDEDVIEIDEIDDDEDGNADDEYEEQLDDEAISSPAHISRQPTSTEAPVPRADLLLNIKSPSVGDSLSPNEARRVGSDSLGAEGEEFLTPGIVTPTSLSSNREEEDWAREKQKGFVELDMDADADIMPDVVGGDELIPSSSPTFQQLPILRMLPTDESPSDLQQSSLAFSSPMEGSVRPLREQLPVVDTHRVEVPPHALDDDLPASSPILSSPVGPEHPQLHADSHGGRVLQAELADDIMDLNGLYDDIYTDPPQEIYELDVGMLEHAVGVVEDEGEDEGEEEDSVGPVAPSLMKSSDAEISPHNSCHGDDPAVLADNDEEYDELASSHGDGVASKPIVSATGVESERVAGHGPQLIQVGGFDTVLPADPPTAARRNVGTPRCLEPLLGFDGQLAQNPTPPIVFEATPLEHESMPLMNSGPSSSLQASRSCDETNTKGPGPFQHSRFLPSPPPDVDSHIPTQRETAIPSDIVDMRDRAAGMLEEIEQGLTSAEEFFIGAASDTIHGTSQKDGSRVSEVGNVPRGAVPEIDGVRRPDGHPELLESDVGVELDDDVSASRESITEKSPYAADSAGVSESASRCESNDEIMETCSQVSDAPPDASNADAPDIKIEVESPRPNIDGTTTPNSDLVISSPPPNTLLGILPPPVIADPNIPDPVFHAETQRGDDVGLTQRPQTPPLDVANSERNVATPTRIPLVLSMPSTPAIMLSPVGTPGTGRPTPVSVPIPASILMAFQRQKSRGGLATSGLFTPIPSVPTPTNSSQATEVSLYESEAPLQDRHDSSIDLENVKEEPQAQAEPSPPPKLQRQLREEPSIKLEQSSMENAENIPATTPPPTIVSPPLPLASGSVEPAKHDFSCSTTPPALNQMIMTQKPTHPILYADPYPYSLSTPGAKDALWDGSEADTEHDNSMTSSSTIEKEINDIPELGYPDLSDPEVVETRAVTNDNILDPIHFVEEDTDADGDLDPEFLAHHELANRTAPELEPKSDKETSPKPVETAIRPAPGSISENANANTNLHTTSVAEILTHPQPQGSSISSAETTQSPSTFAKKAEARSIADSESSTTSQSTKRKRSPLPYSTRLTRSMSSKGVDTKLSKKNLAQVNKSSAASSISAKSKGKGKETLNRLLSRKYSGRPESSASSSGASSTYRILRDNSRRASRESSVASTATSDKSSIQIQPSPTVMKPSNIHRPQMVPPPLFHAHTFPRTAVPHHHHPPPSLAQEQLNKQIKGISAFDRAPALQAADFARPQPGSQYQSQPQTASSSQPSSSQKAVVYSTSPVTRSNCRYHKISLPLEEGGPRVCFLVPGCSLGDRELMEEEEIEDHGDATHEDSQRIIRDIESLDFDPYLIGILRQLVGVDLLQKQEVFYLPQPGQEPIQRSQPHKSTTESRTSVSSREPGTSAAGAMPSPTSSRNPISISGSAATSISFFRGGSESDEPLSDITDSELDEEDEPAPKRPKLTSLDDPASSISMGPPKASHLKARRSLRLGKEGEVDSDLRSENSKPPRARRSQARTNAGGKRSRMSEVTPGEETRHTKRPRTRGAAEEADRSA